ncbi:MAG: C4-type zinc ribbon domain-containing protein [Clostridia bacterium]
MNIKNMMEYQQKDSEAISLERELFSNIYKKSFTEMLSVVKESKSKTIGLEIEAQKILKTFDVLKSRFEENSVLLEKLNSESEEDHSQKEMDEIFDKIATISNNLNFFEKKMLALAEQVNNTLNEFETAKKRYSAARNKYNENKNKYEEVEAKIKPEIDKIKESLKILEKDIDPDLIHKYNMLRQDKIFPVFVPFEDKRCGGCRMELSYSAQSQIKEKNYIECEHCRRIICNI